MIAVDAGVHLASIIRILQQHMPLQSKEKPPSGYSKMLEEGPFAGINFPGYSARANALYIFRELMHAFLITHPHLDHLSGMGINTPALEYGREAKTIVALGSTIEAIKAHIFNDWIWPNLSDEGSGVGFVTYRRLQEGGNARLGSGDARGYVRVCDSLATLCMPVTHGKCKSRPSPGAHQRNESAGWHDAYTFPQRRLSRISDHESYFAAMSHHGHVPPNPQSFHLPPGQTTPGYSTAPTPTLSAVDHEHLFEPVKSSAFFILNEETGSEILIFGDIEPDSVSITPQNYKVWRSAAPKVANGNLKAIFIECSYDDSVRDADLYGHLCPRHLIHELYFLGKEVHHHKDAKAVAATEALPSPVLEAKRPVEVQNESRKKRKRVNGELSSTPDLDGKVLDPLSPVSQYVGARSASASRKSARTPNMDDVVASPMTHKPPNPAQPSKHVQFEQLSRGSVPNISSPLLSSFHPPPLNTHGSMLPPPHEQEHGPLEKLQEPLKGLTVHIIHVKDTLVDGPPVGDTIAVELKSQANYLGLGCDFDVTESGESIWV